MKLNSTIEVYMCVPWLGSVSVSTRIALQRESCVSLKQEIEACREHPWHEFCVRVKLMIKIRQQLHYTKSTTSSREQFWTPRRDTDRLVDLADSLFIERLSMNRNHLVIRWRYKRYRTDVDDLRETIIHKFPSVLQFTFIDNNLHAISVLLLPLMSSRPPTYRIRLQILSKVS